MVTLEEVHVDTSVHELLQRGEDADITLGNDVLVFIPEVPYVTEKIQ